ncbi:protein TolR [Chitinilyticum piscinae]|uniref:Protein TolR n=1 Tax=Chitinilyticum piscinae TaxID=2866724 RepID=A0A8J7K0P4_9NEIS|nr:protein TolR [Chitinilyticum piscinae]MBE9608186.1 protein TolR [Chitinilyticum piscinae]
MRTRRPRRAKSEINVVPYIDVMLVLLVIFMVAAPMMQQGTIELPSVGKTSKQQNPQPPLFVMIDKDGALQLKEKAEQPGEGYADIAQLVAAAKSLAGQGDNARPVVISADKNVRYEQVMNVMDGLKAADIERVALQVQAK